MLLNIFLIVLFVALQNLAWAGDDATTMTVVIVYGAPGHSAIHLSHAGEQLYWDPGGAFGEEYATCLEDSSERFCRRFDGFPWQQIEAKRQADVFIGDVAELMRVISIYHLDGDDTIKVYTFQLHGALAQQAWDLLDVRQANKPAFDTDRNPMFCVKGVTDYLATLGGRFANISHPWYPEELGAEMARIGAQPSEVYTLRHPAVQHYIQQNRRQLGIEPFSFVTQQSDSIVDQDPMSVN